jgi:class 3 adenylate cyclase
LVVGEHKSVTIPFADLKGSMELLADRDPEEARQLLEPVLTRMIDAVRRYEVTVNQVMGDGIMALFGAPLAHEVHAVRACYAALRVQDAIGRYTAELRQRQGLDVQIWVGLNTGAVVVRSIGNDLHMDYAAVGQTTHLAACLEQLPRERGERGHEARALRFLCEMASHQSRPDVATAEVHYIAAWALASELGMRPLAAHCHLGLGTRMPRSAGWNMPALSSPPPSTCTASWR